jgi:hypothetical protein
LQAVVEDIRKFDVDGVITAGDYLVQGPYPVETSRLSQSLDGWMIRGNAEGCFWPMTWVRRHRPGIPATNELLCAGPVNSSIAKRWSLSRGFLRVGS